MLIALVVLGLVVVALLFGFATSITASGEHRHVATLDASVRAAADQAISQVQQQAKSGTAFPCPDTFTPTFSLPGSFTVTSYQVAYWDTTDNTFDLTTCPSATSTNHQQVSMTVGSGAYSTTIQTVIVDPAVPQSAGGSGQATQLVWLQSPAGGTINSPVSPQPIIAVEDSSGNIVYNDLSSVTLRVSTGPGSLSSNCSGVESYGVVPFGDCSLNAVGDVPAERG